MTKHMSVTEFHAVFVLDELVRSSGRLEPQFSEQGDSGRRAWSTLNMEGHHDGLP